MSMIFYIKIFKTQNIGLYIFDIFVKIEVSDMSVITDNYYYLLFIYLISKQYGVQSSRVLREAAVKPSIWNLHATTHWGSL